MIASKVMSLLSWLAISAVAAALLVVVCVSRHPAEAPVAASPMDSWSISEMIARLRQAGLEFRVVATREDAATAPNVFPTTDNNVFLTTTDQGWTELNLLPKLPDHIERWRGTLYVESLRPDQDWSIRTQLWGDYYLVVGRFLFFGDPELLARVHEVLGKP
jgi:hypothetical protein